MTMPPAPHASYSGVALVAGIVATAGFLTAGVLFVSGEGQLEKLGILSAFLTTIVLGLLAVLRADQAAKSTDAASSIATGLNGAFDARVRNANRITAEEPPGTPLEPVVPHHDPDVLP